MQFGQAEGPPKISRFGRFHSFVCTLLLAATVMAQPPQPARLKRPSLPADYHPNYGPALGSPSLVQSAAPSVSSTTWTPIGPASLSVGSGGANGTGNVSGRITGIAIDPTNNNNIYIAAAGGGVWQSTDGGSTWNPVTDNQPTLSMGAIAIAPSNHLKVYAGTGEANNSGDSNFGRGILVSGDGGATWSLATGPSGAFSRLAVAQISVDPSNANTAYAALNNRAENGLGANTGIYKTTDGGVTWINVTAANGKDSSSPWSGVVVDPNTPFIVYAAHGDPSGAAANGVYRSADGGISWSLLSAPSGTGIGRISLAAAAPAASSGNHKLYVAIADPGTGGLYRMLVSSNADAGTPTFTNLSNTPDFMGGANSCPASPCGQGSYDQVIAVDPQNVNIVYAAGMVTYGNSSMGIPDKYAVIRYDGTNWSDITIVNGIEPHTDSHAMAIDSNGRLLLGTDGGIWRYRYDPTVPSWTNLNGNLNTIQFTGVGLHPTSSSVLVGGSQDNGTEVYNGSFWSQTDGGDGGFARISQTPPIRFYHTYNQVSFQRSDDGGTTWVPKVTGINATTKVDFYPPFTVDPTNGDHLLFGTDALYETTSAGDGWTKIGVPGTNGFNPSDNPVSAVALASGTGFRYAATSRSDILGSRVFVTSNDGGNWQERDSGLSGPVNEIDVDPNDSSGSTAYAVVSSFNAANGQVFKTNDAGLIWMNISGNLPQVPVWSLKVDTDAGHTVYVSTEGGVYSSSSPYSIWTLYGTGLPNAQGVDLELNTSLHLLALATHGRGAWEILTPAGATPATMISPSIGSTLAGSSVTFQWTTGAGIQQYFLYVGNSPGTSDIYGQSQGTNLSVTVNSLPTDGRKLYVRLWSLAGSTWLFNDSTYTAALIGVTPVPAAMTSPANGSTLSGASVSFQWNTGTAIQQYFLYVGNSPGTLDIYGQSQGTNLSVTVNSLPTDGRKLYVRLWSLAGSTWLFNDYTYTAALIGVTPIPAAMTSPANGSTLSGASVTFQWNTGTAIQQYFLYIGSAVGTSDIYSQSQGTNLSVTVNGLPTDGRKLYVRLWSLAGSSWLFNDSTYTAALIGVTPVAAAMTSPANGSTLSGSSATFQWNTGTAIQQYFLYIGNSVGTNDIYGQSQGTNLSVTVSGLPTDGRTLYVRLWSLAGFTWLFRDYTYTAAGGGSCAAATMTSPANNSVLSGSSVTFHWTTGTCVTDHFLYVGTALGQNNIIGKDEGSATQDTVSGLPADGSTVYVRLWSQISGTWYYFDYTYIDNKFYVGQYVSVYNTNGLGLNLRSCASTSCSIVVNMPDGTVMQVVGGPTQASGYTWWNLSGNVGGISRSGWAVQDYLH
jgi:photosystem II stability/assembly factor-like uncharacterized protein